MSTSLPPLYIYASSPHSPRLVHAKAVDCGPLLKLVDGMLCAGPTALLTGVRRGGTCLITSLGSFKVLFFYLCYICFYLFFSDCWNFKYS